MEAGGKLQVAPAGPSRNDRPQATEARALAALRDLLDRRRPAAAEYRGGLDVPLSNGPTPLITGELVYLLTELQNNDSTPEAPLAAEVREAIATELGQISDAGIVAPAMAPRDVDVLEVTSLLLEVLLDDPALPPTARSVLQRLRFPLLKVALLDPDFFPNKNHPARRLANRLAQAAADPCRLPDAEAILDRLLKEFETDIGLFDELLASPGLQPPADANATELRRARACQEVDALLARRLKGVAAPQPVAALLRGPWRKVLVAARIAADAKRWKQGLGFVEILLQSVAESLPPASRRMLAAKMPAVIALMRQGLRDIGTPRDRIEALIAQLEPIHHSTLRVRVERRVETPGADSDQMLKLDDLIATIKAQIADLEELEERPSIEVEADHLPELDELDEQLPPDPGPTDPAFLRAAIALPENSWLELEEAGSIKRLRLSWKSELLDRCIFVDRRLKIAGEMRLSALARLIEAGLARPVEDVALFDRAVDTLLHRLSRD